MRIKGFLNPKPLDPNPRTLFEALKVLDSNLKLCLVCCFATLAPHLNALGLGF